MTQNYYHVTNDDLLYRRVEFGASCYSFDGNQWIFSKSAFSDYSHKPSVDIAFLCERQTPSGAEWTQSGGCNAVVKFNAGEARAIAVKVESKVNGITKTTEYTTNIEHDPTEATLTTPANPAHAEVRTNPPMSRSHFEKLTKRLQLISTWAILPAEARGFAPKVRDNDRPPATTQDDINAVNRQEP